MRFSLILTAALVLGTSLGTAASEQTSKICNPSCIVLRPGTVQSQTNVGPDNFVFLRATERNGRTTLLLFNTVTRALRTVEIQSAGGGLSFSSVPVFTKFAGASINEGLIAVRFVGLSDLTAKTTGAMTVRTEGAP
jgi:hypothetical protein